MKRVIAAVVALLVLAWPAATWWTGKQVESRLAEQYKMFEQVPLVKVVKRDFRRGFASSTDDATFEVFGDMFRSLGQAQQAQGNAAEVPEPLVFTVSSRIAHGPVAGGRLSAAVVDSEFVLDDKSMLELAKVLGDKKPLTARTIFGFDGSGHSTVESPAFTHRFTGPPRSPALAAPRGGAPAASQRPGAADGPDGAAATVTVTWGGVKADTTFTRDMASFTLKGEVPSFEVQDDKGMHMVVTGIRMTGDQKRLFADEPMLYGGKQQFDIAQVDLKAVRPNEAGAAAAAEPEAPAVPVTMKNLTYTVDIPVAGGEFVDMITRMSAASLRVDQQEFGPAHYDVSARHLHARTVAKVYRALLQMYADPRAMADNPGAAFGSLMRQAMDLLAHDPEFAIDRIAFTSKHGQAHMGAHVKLKDVKPEDLSAGLALLAKLDVTADMKLPEALLAELGGAKAQTPEDRQMAQQMFLAQVDAMAQQGYVTRTNGILESKLAFAAGQLTINGKPFDPSALAGGAGTVQAAPAEAEVEPELPNRQHPRARVPKR